MTMTTGSVTNSTIAVLAKLDAFEGPDEIAAYLHSRQITGYRHHALQCPLANYLLAETGVPHVVGPGICHRLDSTSNDIITNHELPDVVAQFVAYVDNGHYPELAGTYPADV